MNRKMKLTAVTASLVAVTVLGSASSCDSSESEQRKAEQKASVLQGDSLEKRNLVERVKRENNPNAVGYVYLVNFGKPFGYYTIKGKVSSAGSQVGPEQEILCPYTGVGESCNTVDSKQDDGTYGNGDPGIFFFTADGIRVETTLDYIYSDQPLAIDVPRLDAKATK